MLSRNFPETENGLAPLAFPLFIEFVVFGFESSQNEITGKTDAVNGTNNVGKVIRRFLNYTMLTADAI
jgi:hypothetical protein